MKRQIWSLLIIVLVVVLYVARNHIGGPTTTVDYRGEQFKMRKGYWSYEDYKDDPYNLATNELPRIEKLMLEASIGPSFDTRKQFFQAVSDLVFPGYGCGTSGDRRQPDGSTLLLQFIEIPPHDNSKERYFVAQSRGSMFTLVDDFVVSPATNLIFDVRLEGTKLRYYDDRGGLVREKQM